MNLIKRPLLGLIRLYQLLISPLLGQNCRFTPSCSQYAKDAIEKKNILQALGLISWRVLRCHPFCKGGHDPVE